MGLNEKEIMNILKMVNDSDYGYLSLEVDGVNLSTIKKDMNLSELSQALNLKNTNESASNIGGSPVVKKENEQEVIEDVLVDNEPVKNQVVNEQPKEYSDNQIIIKAPMLGTFYRKPSPDEAEYVVENQIVNESDTICLIEVMKLFNSIPAGVKGKIVEFLADDGEMVEFDQPLLVIELV